MSEIIINTDEVDNTIFTRFLVNQLAQSGEVLTVAAGCVFATSKTVVFFYNQDILTTYPSIESMYLDFPEELGYSIIYLDKNIVPQHKVN